MDFLKMARVFLNTTISFFLMALVFVSYCGAIVTLTSAFFNLTCEGSILLGLAQVLFIAPVLGGLGTLFSYVRKEYFPFGAYTLKE